MDLALLEDKVWIDVSCIDLWLLDMWCSLPRSRFRYLPTFFIPPVGQGEVSREEIDHFRSLFPLLLSTDIPCPYENVVHVLNIGGRGQKLRESFLRRRFCALYELDLCHRKEAQDQPYKLRR